jgi:hypothetical protein
MLVAATEPVRIPPSGPWHLEYAENSCRLIRTFGDGKTKTVLLLESAAPERMEMLVIGRPLKNYAKEVGARFLPVGGKTFKGSTAESTTNRDPAILWSHVFLLPETVIENLEKKHAEERPDVRPPPIDLAERDGLRSERQQFAKRATALEIQTRRNHPVILETGPMGEPIRMLDQCSRDSLKDWGIDPDLEDKIVRRPWAADPARWFSSHDYPRDMLARREESEVSVRLLVDASGNVTKCTSLSQFKEPEFNRITCANFMKRARLAPAELADGTKVPSYYTKRVVFSMER